MPAVPLCDAAAPSRCSSDADSSSSSDSDSSSSSSSSSSLFDIGGRSKVSKWIQVEIPTCPPMKIDNYKPRGKPAYKRVIGMCKWHAGCQKKRSAAQTELYGHVEPFANIAAWHQMGQNLTKEEHSARQFKISNALIAEWAMKFDGAQNFDQLANLL